MAGVLAVVPTYQPEIASLEALISQLVDWGIPIVVSDDGTPGLDLETPPGGAVTVVQHSENRGIARGLNDGLRAATQVGASWLLTIDQDTHLPDNYLSALQDQETWAHGRLASPIGAVAAGTFNDASGGMKYPIDWRDGVPCTAEVIQTGTLWSVPALLKIGGFDESFGIDAVDAAACVRLRARGYAVVLAPGATFRHRIGGARQLSILGRQVMATGHTPARRETIVRNRLILAPEEFRQSPRQAFRSLRRLATSTLLAVTIEEQRWAKAQATGRGILRAWRSHRARRSRLSTQQDGG